jgi:hypothetical protein
VKRLLLVVALVSIALLLWYRAGLRPEPSFEMCSGDCWTLHVIDDSGNGADGVHLGDIDGDGYVDVVSGWEQSGDLRLYRNQGAGLRGTARWPAVDIGAGLSMRGIEDAAFADLDGDGAVDAVLSSVEGLTQRLAVHRLSGAPMDPGAWRVEALAPDRPARYMKARAARLGPGAVDIVAGTREGGGSEPAIYRFWPGTGGWQRERLAAVDFKTTGLELLDVDGDSWRDVLFAGRGEVVWLRNPGGAGGDWQRHRIAGDVSEFAVCDVDQDGRWDLVAGTSRHSGMVARWFQRPADPTGAWTAWPVAVPGGRPGGDSKFVIKGTACGDLDGDGDFELVFTASGSGHGVFSLAHAGRPASDAPWVLRNHVGYVRGMKYDNVELADIDLDGDLDIVTSEEGEGIISPGLGVVWLENPLSGAEREVLARDLVEVERGR